MKKKQKPLSFSLCEENHTYIEAEQAIKHRSRSHWMDDLITHLRLRKEASKPDVLPRSNSKKYPINLDEQFLMLWDTKGKKGSKKNAYAKFKALSQGVTDDVCERFTQILVDDILKRQHEIGVKEQHLITYLNKEEWDK